MKAIDIKGMLLSLQFIIMTYVFTRGLYSVFFIFLMIILILLAFLNEQERIFTWSIIAFFIGYLLLGYMDTLIEGFNLSSILLVITGQLLVLIPIIMVSYIFKKFNHKIFIFCNRPKIKLKIIVISCIGLCLILILFIVYKDELHGQAIFYILLLSIINSVLEEFLWRGMFLPSLSSFTGNKFAIFVTSVAFGVNTTMYGISPLLIFGFSCLGILLGALTVKSKSIFPSIIVHGFVTTLLFITGVIVIPI
ncbi:type II CAAX endopeptidase family protein [Neobacillus pocheonensis]|uniref:CPBP family intramembrane glutamic endopeptidase n=1 Tax=Neobacillus pocheonensis TaxID=363869 RepID=UPI003D2B3F77